MCKFTPTCFVDMDGVIVDFHNYFQAWFNNPAHVEFIPGDWGTTDRYCEATGISKSHFWSTLKSDFWASMPWTPDGLAILMVCESVFGPENVCILSSPANEESAHGKICWFKRQLPNYLKEGRVYLGRDKRFVAAPLSVLIDDGDHNIDRYRQWGGLGLLVPRFWNSAFAQRDDAEKLTIAGIYKSRSIIDERKIIFNKMDFIY